MSKTDKKLLSLVKKPQIEPWSASEFLSWWLLNFWLLSNKCLFSGIWQYVFLHLSLDFKIFLFFFLTDDFPLFFQSYHLDSIFEYILLILIELFNSLFRHLVIHKTACKQKIKH